MKKKSKKLLLPAGWGTAIAKAPGKQKFFASFFQKRSAFFSLLMIAAPLAQAQQFPQDATPGKCIPTPHLAPGDGPGGNIFASHFGPQPLDAPNNDVASFPAIQPTPPDTITTDSTPQNDTTYPAFPFSGGINDPILSQSGGPETSSSTNKGC